MNTSRLPRVTGSVLILCNGSRSRFQAYPAPATFRRSTVAAHECLSDGRHLPRTLDCSSVAPPLLPWDRVRWLSTVTSDCLPRWWRRWSTLTGPSKRSFCTAVPARLFAAPTETRHVGQPTGFASLLADVRDVFPWRGHGSNALSRVCGILLVSPTHEPFPLFFSLDKQGEKFEVTQVRPSPSTSKALPFNLVALLARQSLRLHRPESRGVIREVPVAGRAADDFKLRGYPSHLSVSGLSAMSREVLIRVRLVAALGGRGRLQMRGYKRLGHGPTNW